MTKKREDAAKEALRIIEAAGDGETEDVDFAEARYRLRCSVQKTAEREAEDAKVREWLRKVHGPALGHSITGPDRTEYRLNLDFFTRIDAEPLVLQYGDPEPAHDTKWRDTRGNVWSYGYTCHRDYPVWQFQSAGGFSFGRWSYLDSCFFPMTEETS